MAGVGLVKLIRQELSDKYKELKEALGSKK